MRFKAKRNHNNQCCLVIEAGGNYATVAMSEMYESRRACEHAIEVFKKETPSASLTEETASSTI